jgi:hypothetical protein
LNRLDSGVALPIRGSTVTMRLSELSTVARALAAVLREARGWAQAEVAFEADRQRAAEVHYQAMRAARDEANR